MYNEAFARAALAERARDREAALFLKSLDCDEPARARRRARRSPMAFVRGIPASVLWVAMARPWRPNRDDDPDMLADT